MSPSRGGRRQGKEFEVWMQGQHKANRQRRTIYVIVILAGLLLAWRSQTLSNHERDSRHSGEQTAYASCIARGYITLHNNQTFARLADIERENQFIDAAVRQNRVAVYAQAQSTPVDCSVLPHSINLPVPPLPTLPPLPQLPVIANGR